MSRRRARRLVVFLHHGRYSLREETLTDLRGRRVAIERARARLVVVYAGMPGKGGALLDQWGLHGVDVIADPLRELYRALRLQQGALVHSSGHGRCAA